MMSRWFLMMKILWLSAFVIVIFLAATLGWLILKGSSTRFSWIPTIAFGIGTGWVIIFTCALNYAVLNTAGVDLNGVAWVIAATIGIESCATGYFAHQLRFRLV